MTKKYLFYVTMSLENSDDLKTKLPSFTIVEETYWKQNQGIDCIELGDLDGLLHDNWHEEMEATYVLTDDSFELLPDPNSGRMELLRLGLKEISKEEWPFPDDEVSFF